MNCKLYPARIASNVSPTISKLICALFLFATAAFGQGINVIVLKEKNGTPLRNSDVWVQFYEAPANRELKRIQLKTGPDGAAHIQLPQPPPAKLTLSASATSFYQGFVVAATADIVNQGALSRCDSKAKAYARIANPGEVVFLMCRIPLWVRLLAPLERE